MSSNPTYFGHWYQIASVQICPKSRCGMSSRRQEVGPIGLELRKGRDEAGTEEQAMKPDMRVHPWYFITGQREVQRAVWLGAAVWYVVGCPADRHKVKSTRPWGDFLLYVPDRVHTSKFWHPKVWKTIRKLLCSGQLLCSLSFLCWGSLNPDLKGKSLRLAGESYSASVILAPF